MSADCQIPPAIIQYWHQQQPPKEVSRLMTSWQKLNPEMHYELFDDSSAQAFLQENFSANILLAYRQCAIPAMKSDFFRYAYLLMKGGIYVDADEECIQPIKPHLNFNNCLIVLKRPVNKQKGFIRWTNRFIAASPQNNIIKEILLQCVKNINGRTSNSLYKVTGPFVFSQVLKSHIDDKNLAIQELSLKQFKQFVRPWGLNDLAYKRENHWSKQQQIMSIYN